MFGRKEVGWLFKLVIELREDTAKYCVVVGGKGKTPRN